MISVDKLLFKLRGFCSISGLSINFRHKLQAGHYSGYLSRLVQWVNLWKKYHLSFAGKLFLIKTVIQGVNCFWFSALPIPVSVMNQVNRICIHFLWGEDNGANKRAKVSWKQVCLPKSEGGLGVMQLRS